MSASPAAPPDGYVEVHDAPPDVFEVLSHVEQYLTPGGRQQMHQEVGEALMHDLATGGSLRVNRVVEAWLRTLVLKAAGVDERLAASDDASAEGAPVSIEELRARLR